VTESHYKNNETQAKLILTCIGRIADVFRAPLNGNQYKQMKLIVVFFLKEKVPNNPGEQQVMERMTHYM
jgi:hypothetical protein